MAWQDYIDPFPKGCCAPVKKPVMRDINEYCIAADKVRRNRGELKMLLDDLIMEQDRFSNSDYGFIYDHIKGYIEKYDDAYASKVAMRKLNAE